MNLSSKSTRTLTTRLARFFALVSLVIAIVVAAIFAFSLQWAEDHVGKKRIFFDKDYAIERYNKGETGIIKLDQLTTAYDNSSLIPPELQPLVAGKAKFLGETSDNKHSRMVYIGTHKINGKDKTIILLSDIDSVELSLPEFYFAIAIMLIIFIALMLLFGVFLYRLSQTLISPINLLSKQLENNIGNTESSFSIKPTAAMEFKQFADQLNQYRDEINTLIKREQAFARYASHELRTPLTIIQGANKLLQRADKTDFQQRQLQRIEDASHQMTAMVDALLSLVRYEKHNQDIDNRAFTETELRTIIERNSQYTLDKSISITLSVTEFPIIKASPAIMNMIVGNLIRNALTATPQGEIKILMDQNSLCILDNGAGLDTNNNSVQRLSKQASGHGLGLLIVAELCQRYQWQFQLKNHVSNGCIAIIKFTAEIADNQQLPLN